MTNPQFQPGDPVVLQGTLKAKIVRQISASEVIIAFGQATKVVPITQLTRGEQLDETDYK